MRAIIEKAGLYDRVRKRKEKRVREIAFPLSAANSHKTRCHQVSRNTFSVYSAHSSVPAAVTGFKYSH